MNRFALPEPTIVTIEHINVRDENHGDEKVTAIDVKLSMECSNHILALFHPLMRLWLYFKSSSPASRTEQPALDLEEPNDLPDLRFPHLDPLKWHEDLEGRTLVLDYGIGGSSNVKFADCKANEFKIECKQGGTVKLTWRVQCSQPGERAIGKLAGILKHQVPATMIGSPESLALLEGAAPGSDEAWPFNESAGAVDGEPDATSTFVAAHGSAQA